MAEIPVTGIASNFLVPGVYSEVVLGGGPALLGQGSYYNLIIANSISSGSASDDTVYGPDTFTSLTSKSEAESLFGAGSPAARMYNLAISINRSSPTYVLSLAEPSGDQADGYVTISGASATNGGTLRVLVGHEEVKVGISKGDANTDVATELVTQLNLKTNFPCTATDTGSGAVQLIAKSAGADGNKIRIRAQIIGSNVGITVTPTGSTAMTGGSGAVSVATALSNIEGQRYYNMICGFTDSTELGLVKTHIETQDDALTGNRQRMFVGNVDNLATATTLATSTLNSFRANVAWLQDSDMEPSMLAAQLAAVISYEELALLSGAGSALNFSSYGARSGTESAWRVPVPGANSAGPSVTVQNSALLNGLTPIAVSGQSTYLVKWMSTKAEAGHLLRVTDQYTDDAEAKLQRQFPGKKIGDDVPLGQSPGTDVITPADVKRSLSRLVDIYANAGLVGEVAAIKANMEVVRSAVNPSRVSFRVLLRVIDILDQFTGRIEQVSGFES